MKRFAKYMLGSVLFATAITLPTFAQTARTQITKAPAIYVVMFHADWCGPCKIVEPNLKHALESLRDPSIEHVVIDITHPHTSERSAHLAFDRNIVRQYNEWMGVTGFAAIIDADTKNTLGCVNLMYDAESMATHIKNLKTYALANQKAFDITCPAANPAVR